MPDPDSTASRTVGVRDVAALAKVSRQTVSRVLNQNPDVAPATRERVLWAMKRLDYRMNNAARALGTRRTRTLGVLATDMLQYGPMRSLAAIEASAREAGYWVSTAFADSADRASVVAALDHLRAQAVDGLVVFAPHALTVDAVKIPGLDIPVVLLLTAGDRVEGPITDQVAGARLATAALSDAGHTRIAHLSGPDDWLEARARREGYEAELRARGQEVGPVLVGDWSPRSGYEAAGAVQASGATGVFAANDQMAIGLINGLRARGVAVPEQISVVGFDDIPEAEYSWPRLTTVRQDFDEVARHAVATLTRPEARPDEKGAIILAPSLIRRDSVAPPPPPRTDGSASRPDPAA